MSVPWSAASALPRRAPACKQALTPIGVTSSLPGTRDAKNQVRAEPAGTVQPSPTIRRNNSPTVTDSPTVRNCHQLTEKRSSRPFYRQPVWADLKQTSAKSTLSIGASLHVTNRQSRDHPFLVQPDTNKSQPVTIQLPNVVSNVDGISWT